MRNDASISLVEELKRQLACEPSYFRQHLLMEDTKRLERLAEMAASSEDVRAFVAAGMKVGWTAEDRRTHELAATLKPLLEAIYARFKSQAASIDLTALDREIETLWQAFDTNRIEQLTGCLSRVPRPPDATN